MPSASTPAARSAVVRARVVAWVRWHRRSVALGLAVLGLVLVVGELRPAPPPTTAVLTAARDLSAGRIVMSGDLRTTRLPTAAVPDGALRAPPVGRSLALPVRRGEVLTDVRVMSDGLLRALGTDGGAEIVAAPVHLADPSAAALLRPGDTVDVLAAGPAGATTVAASGARVLLEPDDAVVVLAVAVDEARALARSAVLDRLSVVVRADPSTAVP